MILTSLVPVESGAKRVASGPRRRARARLWAAFLSAGLMLCMALAHPAVAEPPPVRVAVADFDNIDTSGEGAERTVAHAARVKAFGEVVGDLLAAEGKFDVVQLVCPTYPCSPATLPPEKFIEAARESGARVVVYGGIQKLSTLVQIGLVQAVDLKAEKLILNQHVTFRGDTDEAFRRAAIFIVDHLSQVTLEP